jgi:hypothetical protein
MQSSRSIWRCSRGGEVIRAPFVPPAPDGAGKSCSMCLVGPRRIFSHDAKTSILCPRIEGRGWLSEPRMAGRSQLSNNYHKLLRHAAHMGQKTEEAAALARARYGRRSSARVIQTFLHARGAKASVSGVYRRRHPLLPARNTGDSTTVLRNYHRLCGLLLAIMRVPISFLLRRTTLVRQPWPFQSRN